MPGAKSYESGIKAIPEILSIQPHVQILVFTGSKEIKDCVEAMQFGARDYITKAMDRSLLYIQIEKAIEQADAILQKIRLERSTMNSEGKGMSLVGRSNAVRSLRSKLQMISSSQKPVLLTGETGTGKTTAAKMIHDYYMKKQMKTNSPFVALNMASIPSTLAERELFGNEKGAFTGANESRTGYIELANGGTHYLDEIGEASLDLQAKLLKVLDDGKFYRIGGSRELQSSFKLICATNRNLEEMIREKTFREDLFMRIATLQIGMPSLKERRSDVPDIIALVLEKVCRENNTFVKFKNLPRELIEFLTETPPSGNIRGLEQILCQLLVFSPKSSDGTPQLTGWKAILGIGTPVSTTGFPTPISLEELRLRNLDVFSRDFPGLKDFESEISSMLIERALKTFKSYNKAAKMLGLAKSSLMYRHQLQNGTRSFGLKRRED